GERHIGAGVAIRDREDVESIDAVAVVLQPGGGKGKCVSHGLARPERLGRCGGDHCPLPLDSPTRSPSTLMLTRSTRMPRISSTRNLTAFMALVATVKMGVPYCTTTERSIVTVSPSTVMPMPRWLDEIPSRLPIAERKARGAMSTMP